MLLGTVEVVEHREEGAEHFSLGGVVCFGLLAVGATAVVGVLRLDALEVLQALLGEIALARGTLGWCVLRTFAAEELLEILNAKAFSRGVRSLAGGRVGGVRGGLRRLGSGSLAEVALAATSTIACPANPRDTARSANASGAAVRSGAVASTTGVSLPAKVQASGLNR